jgi:hypothetical protein
MSTPRTEEGQVAAPPTAEEMGQQSVRAQLEEALREQCQAAMVFIVEMDKTMVGPSTFERGQKLAGLLGTLQDSLKHTGAALDRARREPERCSLRDCGFNCPCYQEGLDAQRE